MSLIEGVAAFTKELNNRKIVYGIIGGLAVFAYGGERTTFDIDFLIHGENKDTVKTMAKAMGLNVVNENPEVLKLSGLAQINVVFANQPATQAMLGNLRKVGNFPYPIVAAEDLVELQQYSQCMERDPRIKKTRLTFEKYCQLIEELLKLTGRKIKPREIPPPGNFRI